MFRYHDKLKKLPIPKLEDTISQYKKYVIPLLNDEEYQKQMKIMDDFVSGDGPILHELLMEKQMKADNDSWLYSLWNDMYLQSRDRIATDLNYYIMLKNDDFKSILSHPQILALCIVYITKMYFKIIDGMLSVDIEKNKFLSMQQYQYLFGGTRIPADKQDEYFVRGKNNVDSVDTRSLWDLDDDARSALKKNASIILYYKNKMYSMEVSDDNGIIYSIQRLESIIQHIINQDNTYTVINTQSNIHSNNGKIEQSVIYDPMIFSTLPRDDAYVLYKKIMNNTQNAENFKLIKNAISVVCLDDEQMNTDTSDITKQFLCGNIYESEKGDIDNNSNNIQNIVGINRYFDKSTQIILTKDKQLGILSEHSHTDGSLYKRFMMEMHDCLIKYANHLEGYLEGQYPSVLSFSELCEDQSNDRQLVDSEPNVYPIIWDIDDTLNAELKDAYDSYMDKVNDTYTRLFVFDKFGRDFIKELDVSPDAFFHTCLQLAQYRVFGNLQSTYESVAMRDYKNGRTECNRPLSIQMKQFVEYYDSGKSVYIKKYLQQALDVHCSQLHHLRSGEGMERHLFGMHQMNTRYLHSDQAAIFFNSDAYKKLKYDYFATSNLGGEHIWAFGYGAVVKDGYGIAYSVNKKEIRVTISADQNYSKHCNQMIENLFMAFDEIVELLQY